MCENGVGKAEKSASSYSVFLLFYGGYYLLAEKSENLLL
jgi:hypothetical protein